MARLAGLPCLDCARAFLCLCYTKKVKINNFNSNTLWPGRPGRPRHAYSHSENRNYPGKKSDHSVNSAKNQNLKTILTKYEMT